MLVCSLSRSHRFYCSIHFIFLHLVPPFGWRKAAADLYFDMNYISLRKKRCGMLTSIIFHPSLLYYSRIWPVCLSHCHPVLATGRHLRTQLIQTTCQGYSHGHDAFRVADVPKSQTVRWSEIFPMWFPSVKVRFTGEVGESLTMTWGFPYMVAPQ